MFDAYIENNSDGIYITDINRGDLPKGSGGSLLAESLNASNITPNGKLVFKNVINDPTLASYKNGVSASESVLGQTGINALNELGLKYTNVSYEMLNGKLNVVFSGVGQ